LKSGHPQDHSFNNTTIGFNIINLIKKLYPGKWYEGVSPHPSLYKTVLINLSRPLSANILDRTLFGRNLREYIPHPADLTRMHNV